MNFYQGYMDSLCGVYSIINADKVVNNSTDLESRTLFNQIIEYLSERGILKDVIIEGTDHKLMCYMMAEVVGDRIPYKFVTNKKDYKFRTVTNWWKFSKDFMEVKPNRAIIISLDGKTQHLTAVERITDRTLFLKDSSETPNIRRSMCKLQGYKENDKYVIYPKECWYLGKE